MNKILCKSCIPSKLLTAKLSAIKLFVLKKKKKYYMKKISYDHISHLIAPHFTDMSRCGVSEETGGIKLVTYTLFSIQCRISTCNWLFIHDSISNKLLVTYSLFNVEFK